MPTRLLFTVDTELSVGLHQQGFSGADNLRSSIFGECAEGRFGVDFQMDLLEASGMRGAFFVDPMPALIFGRQIVADIVGPILARGHEVQLHIHTEWLDYVQNSPFGGVTGRNIGDFPLPVQIDLLRYARNLLIESGVPSPNAFRAGNYGANDDTLKALSRLEIDWDTSFNPGYLGQDCAIDLSEDAPPMTELHGVCLMPVSGIEDRPGNFRPAQLCALSAREMRAALDHSAETRQRWFTIVTHSFELLSRDRQRPNKLVISRLKQLCKHVRRSSELQSIGFHDLEPAKPREVELLSPSLMRTALRVGEQAAAQLRYEHNLPIVPAIGE